MSITWWSPSSEMRSAARAMDRLIEQFFGERAPEDGTPANAPTYYLPIDIFESDDAYILKASVPGFKQDQVEVTLEEGILTIKAKADDLEVPGRWLRQERPWGSFVRRLEVPQAVEAAKIGAHFDNGELTVTIPKRAKPQPVKIQIASGAKNSEAASN